MTALTGSQTEEAQLEEAWLVLDALGAMSIRLQRAADELTAAFPIQRGSEDD